MLALSRSSKLITISGAALGFGYRTVCETFLDITELAISKFGENKIWIGVGDFHERRSAFLAAWP